ncbi:MAG: peptidase T [Candidatus Krumholzibacteria bacterium]|nr:peptidase T [Candidatus Krumholzibacteria bacterium]
MFDPKYKYTCVDRFLRYAKYDTQSDEESTSFPSTEKQKKLSADLAKELKKMGLKDAAMDKWGYVFATLPANTAKKVPPIAFISHVDTSPAVSGKSVKPVIHRNYRGGDIRLPIGGRVIKVSENPDLGNMKGFDIITSNGATLLGADNKAGIAEIMDAANYLITHPEVKHGPIKVCFTPDEEVGRGTEKIDLKKLGAKYAYTVDGSSRGEVESETFSADMVVLKFIGKNIHPGYAKNKMINSTKIAAAFLESMPKKRLSPETTEKRQGYVHCTTISGIEEATTLKIIIRDFETPKLKEYETLLEELAKKAVSRFPGSKYEIKIVNQYRNMREVLVKHPQVTKYAVRAMRNLGIKPILQAIRGGTDGSRLSFMGLPTPNIFAGEHSFHSQLEWVAVQDMEMAVRAIVEIAKTWEKRC